MIGAEASGEWPGRHRAHRVGLWRGRRARPDDRPPAPYNTWMNSLLTSAPGHTHLPAGLRVGEAIRIAEAITAAHAESTRTMYDWAWSQWERWCHTRGASTLPAEPALNCAYLTERAADGLSVGSIDLACGAIAYQHRRRGLDDPIRTEGVRQVRRGLRRIIGAAPRRQARPLDTDDIRQIVEHIDRSTPLGVRDAAIILLGFASAMRRSELVALTVADVEIQPGGVLHAIRRSKTDQYGDGQSVAVVHGQHAVTDPIAALDAWLAVRGTDPGWLFTAMPNRVVTTGPISGEAISIVLRKRAKGRRVGRRADHRPLAARRTRHHGSGRRRRAGPDRRPDPAQAALHPHRALHPPRPSPGVHLQPRPRTLRRPAPGAGRTMDRPDRV